MSKPEDIPQDVWDAVRVPSEDAFVAFDPDEAQAIVARAVLAERNRCSRIAFSAYARKTEICSKIVRKIRTGVQF